MKDIDDMVLAYEESLRLGRARLSPCLTIPEQVARYRAAQELIQPLIHQVRRLLGGVGVPLLLYPSYISYTLRLNKLCGTCGLQALLREAALLTGVWVGRGLSPEVLGLIRSEVFDMPGLPGPAGLLPE